MKTLVVVDVQYDFASPDGALYVNGSEIIANKVLEVIKDFDHVVFTLDFHPINHCSLRSIHRRCSTARRTNEGCKEFRDST